MFYVTNKNIINSVELKIEYKKGIWYGMKYECTELIPLLVRSTGSKCRLPTYIFSNVNLPQKVNYICYIIAFIIKFSTKCSNCRIQKPLLSSFMSYHRVCNKGSPTGAFPEHIGSHLYLVRLVFVLFHLAITFSVPSLIYGSWLPLHYLQCIVYYCPDWHTKVSTYIHVLGIN